MNPNPNMLVLHSNPAAKQQGGRPCPPGHRPVNRVRRAARQTRVDPVGAVWSQLNLTQKVFLGIHGSILLAVAYHGYKRNGNSVPWGMAWGLGGLVCPTVTMGFALTQGFGTKAS